MFEPLLQYSNPYQAYHGIVDAYVVQGHATALLERLVELAADAEVEIDETLGRFVTDNIAAHDEEFEPFWDVAFGRTQRCLETHDVPVVDALSLVALRLAQFGAQGTCSGTFSRPHRVRWNDWLLPAMDTFHLEANGARLSMTGSLENQRAFELEQTEQGGLIHAYGKRDARKLDRAGELLLLSGDSVLGDVVLEDEFHSIFSYPEIDDAIVGEFEQGLAALQSVPEYESWVRRIVRGIVVCETVQSRTRSSSWSEAPGLVLVSRSDRPHLLAEMLVHEASHQYYYLASRCGSTVTGTDTRMFHSPAVERLRPLNKVLLGYHAFANFFLFYGRYRHVADGRSAEIRNILEMLTEKLPSFEQPLLETDGLSEIGQALFRPLYERVCEARA